MKSCILSYKKQGLSSTWAGSVHISEAYNQLFNLCLVCVYWGGFLELSVYRLYFPRSCYRKVEMTQLIEQ